ncbi:uncharacterized protein [Typha latifolia]|uniref:uncharacterized protein isoform X1 n=2 Tax=Typha latifolia TaxID=4733 RepID=UPI003C2DC863
MVGGRGEGCVHLNRQRNALGILTDSAYSSGSRIEENSLVFDFKESRHRIAGGDPTKIHIGKERLNEMEIGRSSPSVIAKTRTGKERLNEVEINLSSPSVIAKLMGLETLPPARTFHTQKLDTGNCFRKRSSFAGFQEQSVANNKYSIQMRNREHPEFKDVFEVMEATEILEDHNQQHLEGLTNFRKIGPHTTFMSEKLMDAKSAASDEFFHVSEELYDDLDSSDIDDNHILEILQQPNSLFRKHLHDLKCSPPSLPPSHIMILKSANYSKFEKSKVCASSGSPERSNQMPKDVKSAFRKSNPSIFCHSLKENSGRILNSENLGKKNTSQHSHIVVLEPTFGKADILGKTDFLSRKPNNFQSLYRRNQEKGQPESPELYVEGRDWQNFLEVRSHKRQCSREITKEFAKEMRYSASERSRKLHYLGINEWIKHQRPSISLDMHNSATSCRSSKCYGDWDDSYRSSTYPTKTSASKGSRERLSGQWQSAQQFRTGLVGKGPRALSKMIAFSNAENQRRTLDLQVLQENLGGVDVSARQGYPSGTSHRYGWKYGHPKSSSMPTSLPVSSAVYGQNPCNRCTFGVDGEFCMFKDEMNLKFRSSLCGKLSHRGMFPRKSCNCDRREFQPYIGRDEKKFIEVDICMNQEISRNRGIAACAGEPNRNLPDFYSSNVGIDAGKTRILLTTEERPFWKTNTKAVLTKDAKFSRNDQEDYFPIHSDGTDSASLLRSKVSQQLLEPPLEEKSNSGYFKRMCGDLQELQMQLDLLKFDSDTEEPEGENFSLPLTGDILEAFRDGDDRDFSYLLDILIDLGVHSTNQDRLYNYPGNCSMISSMFEKLEKKYSRLEAWSRSERMLLFDLINSILSEVVALCMCLNPCMKFNRYIAALWGHEGLVEKVWQMLVRQRKELTGGNPESNVLDPKWLDLGDEVDTMGSEIEIMLNNELLEELLLEIY